MRSTLLSPSPAVCDDCAAQDMRGQVAATASSASRCFLPLASCQPAVYSLAQVSSDGGKTWSIASMAPPPPQLVKVPPPLTEAKSSGYKS